MAARGLTAADLRKLADDIDAEEAKLEEADSRKQQQDAQARLEALEARYDRLEQLYIEQGGVPPSDDEDENDDDQEPPPTKKKQPAKKKPAGRTRPGRKAGQAYDYDVDDDGRIVSLSVAQVYSGEDEPDEVQLPDDDDGDED